MSDFQSQLDRLYRRILMMVTPVQITTTNDSGNVLTAQIGVSNTPEIIDTVPLLQYYGFHANPPPKTDAIAVFGGGERSNAVIVGTNDTKSRPRNYKPGEIGMFTNEGDTLKFARQQAVTLTAGNSFTANTKQATIKGTTGVTLDTPNTHHTGDVKSDGKVDANGGFWKNGVEMGTGGGGGGTVGPPGPAGPTGATGPAGEDGNTVLHGTGAPPTATGQDGDFYIDTTPHSMYGPKAGSWPTPGTSLIGPQGATGAQGAAGVPGPQGPTGATGAQGPQGVKGDTGTAGATGGVGPMGPQGAPGVAGPTGPTGPAASYQAGPGLAINSGTTPPTIDVATPYLALSGGTLSGVLHVTPQATQLGGPAGSLSAPTNANTNLLLYNVSASNYAGIGAAPDGTMYVVTGTSTPATRLVVSPTGVGLGTGATAPSNNVTLISNATGSALGYPVRIGNNNNAAGDNVVLLGGGPNASDTTTKLIGFFDYNGNTLQGAITRNGTAAVAYGTSSDARLKERIVDSALGLDVLMRVRVRDYRMAGDERDQQGFVAQELAEIYPLAVSPGGDDPETEPWLVDYGRLTPLLVSAIQQQQREINELKRMVLGK